MNRKRPSPRAAFSLAHIGSTTSEFVKVCGCRPHAGGAAHTGAGVRKPPREETAEGVARVCVRRYGDFDAGGLLPRGGVCLFGRRPMKRRGRSGGCGAQDGRGGG